jgi:hypothetical protein
MRASNTYRAERRNEWALAGRGVSWRQWNAEWYSKAGYGIPERLHAPSMARAHVARSKYMPHIGDKQRAKGAA